MSTRKICIAVLALLLAAVSLTACGSSRFEQQQRKHLEQQRRKHGRG